MCYDGTDMKNVNTTNDITDQAERFSIEVNSSPSSTDLMSPPNACLLMARSQKLGAWRLALKWGETLFFLSQFDCVPLNRLPA